MIPTVPQPITGRISGPHALPEEFARGALGASDAADISDFAGLLESPGEGPRTASSDQALETPAALNADDLVGEMAPSGRASGFQVPPVGSDLPLPGKVLPSLGDRLPGVDAAAEPAAPEFARTPAEDIEPVSGDKMDDEAPMLSDEVKLVSAPLIAGIGSDEDRPNRTDFKASEGVDLRDVMQQKSANVIDDHRLVAPVAHGTKIVRDNASPSAVSQTTAGIPDAESDLALRPGQVLGPDGVVLGRASAATQSQPASGSPVVARTEALPSAAPEPEAGLKDTFAVTSPREGRIKISAPAAPIVQGAPQDISAPPVKVESAKLPSRPVLALPADREARGPQSKPLLGASFVTADTDASISAKPASTPAATQPNAVPSLPAAGSADSSAQAISTNPSSTAPPASEARAESRVMPNPAAVIEQFGEAREMARASRAELTVRHLEFGSVSVKVDVQGGDYRATLSARDPGFVPAIQAALAERAVAATSETGNAPSHRQSDQGGSSGSSQGSSHASHGGGAGHSEPRYGSSTGSGQSMSQPYPEQTEASDEGAAPGSDPRRGAEGATSGDARDLFA
jgi:hypothetical protein